MFSAHDHQGPSYWGVLINADKSPAPLLEQLCLEIARIIVSREWGELLLSCCAL